MADSTGKIISINGPIVKTEGDCGFLMNEMVYVGEERLAGEVIGLDRKSAVIQVYEDTGGLKPLAPVFGTGAPVSVTLAPGIIGNIFDGIQRPLEEMEKERGPFIGAGFHMEALEGEKAWKTHMLVKEGDDLLPGSVIAHVEESDAILHKVMLPPHMRGIARDVAGDGEYTIHTPLLTLMLSDGRNEPVTMAQKWPIRLPRPVASRFTSGKPLVTGQRILDTLFPLAKGGTAAIPGGFGTGKTMAQHQIAKWSDADIILYIGCGERGNEMTQVLEEFRGLVDPKNGKSMMERTVLIANTSNMPVAAREASLYAGLTLAEYYRDMGYDVAIMVDSTSRWAEALRELSGRLEEMPAEEGFPAYLASKLSGFYERAGMVRTLGGDEGSVSIIGAVSPQGGDFSEPVTQNTKRYVRAFWGLDKKLAYERHFPAIQWMDSYSLYLPDLTAWYSQNVDERFVEYRSRILEILGQESSLMEIVKLIGADVLPDENRLTLEIARVIRLGFLQQNAFHPEDTCVPLLKQCRMMEIILYLYGRAKSLVKQGMPMAVLREDSIWDDLIAIKYNVSNSDLEAFSEYRKRVDAFYDGVLKKNA